MISLPEEFSQNMEKLLGNEAGDFLAAMQQPPVISVRINKRKPGAEFMEATPVKWCASGFYLAQRPEFIFDPLLHAGAYYVQDASSMIYETVIEKIVHEFRPASSDCRISLLDLCAAPGGKSTAMINALPDGSRVTANEYSAKRVTALRENLAKWGYPDVTVTNKDSRFFASGGEAFDIVAVDAPCSGEGMMRKDEFARTQWSPELVEQCVELQKEILSNAVKCLKPGGFLVYSTCTFNRQENEENAEFIARESGLIPYEPCFPKEWGIPRGIDTELPVYRFMPHKTKGEGLFLAIFRKPGDWEPSCANVTSKYFKHNMTQDFPSIEDILKVDFDDNRFPKVEVGRKEALSYLRRESITPPPAAPKGPVIITYCGLPLGPAKNIGSRINNLYPKNWRILKY